MSPSTASSSRWWLSKVTIHIPSRRSLSIGSIGNRSGERPLLPIGTTSILPSGTYRLWIYGRFRAGVLDSRYAAEVAFTDRAGAHWIRHATGQLEKLPEDPITHYLGDLPLAVLPLERLL